MPVALAKVDATTAANKELSEAAGVRGYPTLKMYRGHTTEGGLDYGGPREADGIVSYLTKQAGPASTKLASADAAAALTAAEDVVVFGVAPEGSAEQKAFLAVAQKMRDDFLFAHTADAALVLGGGEAGAGAHVVMVKKFDEPRVAVTDAATVGDETALSAWVAAHANPRVAKLDKDPKSRAALKRVFDSPAPKLFLFTPPAPADKPLLEALDAAARAHPELKFVSADAGENEGALTYFGVEKDGVPALVIQDASAGAKEKKYVKPSAGAADIEAFIAAFAAGELTATVKSEPVPADDGTGVTTLVAKNFDAIVAPANAAGKTILLEFYAPWCGHCKSLAPIYEKVGAHFLSRDDVIVAKMDATANDVMDSRFDVKGFPTLYLQTAAGEVLPYSGERTEEALIKFIEAHADSKDAAAAKGDKHDEL